MGKLLIVVDMQNDFVTDALGSEKAQEIVPAMVEYVKNFDGEVVFTQDTHQENYMDTQEGKKLPVPHCIRGSKGWEIIPALLPYVENRKVFEKPTFGSKALAQYVAEGAYDEVQLIGVCTGICVLSNAIMIKAFSPEVPVKVISNLCACVTPESHETALAAMRTCQIETV